MTDEQRAELKRLAEAATPGPYESHRRLDWQHPQTEVRSKSHDVQILRFARGEPQFWCTTGKKEQEWKNADYLAAASPEVVLDMLREHEEDQGVIAVWRGRTERAEAALRELAIAVLKSHDDGSDIRFVAPVAFRLAREAMKEGGIDE